MPFSKPGKFGKSNIYGQGLGKFVNFMIRVIWRGQNKPGGLILNNKGNI